MKRKALFAAVAAALMSVSSARALAQDAPPAPPVAPAPQAAVAPAPQVADVPEPQAADVAPAPPAQAAPAIAAEPAAAPEPQVGFATAFLDDDGNYLGVRVEEVTRGNMSAYGLTGEPRGVGVTQVLKGSPAERAGLRERDVIVRFDGEAVTSVRKLNRLIAESSPDHNARISVLRGGSEQELSATLARRERLAPAVAGRLFGGVDLAEAQRFGEEWAKNAEEWKRWNGELGKGFEGFEGGGSGVFALGPTRRIGVTTTTLGKQLADYFGVSHGVLVSSVEPGSPAEKAGLRAGDVVTEADGRTVDDASDLMRALGAKEQGEVTLTVVREKKQRTVRVTPERRQTPQGLFVNPSTIIAPPVASIAPRAALLPRAWVAPGIIRAPYMPTDPDFITPPVPLTPRALSIPRIRVAPRVTVVGPGGGIL